LESAEELTVCWRPTGTDAPDVVESRMINEFEFQFGKLPFANLVRGKVGL
jgi:hypothetical protein